MHFPNRLFSHMELTALETDLENSERHFGRIQAQLI